MTDKSSTESAHLLPELILCAQACLDAARSLNFVGYGVQATRATCFEEACRAVFPVDELHDSVREALEQSHIP